MSDLNRGPGTQLVELGEGLLSLGSALGGAANNLQRQADAAAAARQAELDAANKVLLEVGTYNQAGKAQMDYQNGMNSWFLEMRGSGETDPKKWSEAFMEAHNKYSGEAKENNITLPQAQIQFDKFIADEFNKRQTATQDYVFTQFENQAKGIFEANRSSAVATGDFASVERSYTEARAFLTPEQIMKQDDDVAQAKYNSVYNPLAAADPQFALDVLNNEKNAKAVGIDLSVLTPEQKTKMTEDFQKKRDYGEGVQKKADADALNKNDLSLSTALSKLLQGKQGGLSYDMIEGMAWPGDTGGKEKEAWIKTLDSAVDSLKTMKTDGDKEQEAARVIFGKGTQDEKRDWLTANAKNFTGDDYAKWLGRIEPSAGQKEREDIFETIKRFYSDARKSEKALSSYTYMQQLSAEEFDALTSFEEYMRLNDDPALWQKKLREFNDDGTVKKLEDLIEASLGGAFSVTAGVPEWRKLDIYEAARERGILGTDARAMTDWRGLQADIEKRDVDLIKKKLKITPTKIQSATESQEAMYFTEKNVYMVRIENRGGKNVRVLYTAPIGGKWDKGVVE